MAGLSKYLALALFDASLNPVRSALTPPSGLWLAMHTAAPSDSTYGNEATYGAYERQALNSLTAETMAEVAGGDVDVLVKNGSALVFPASIGPTNQAITHWAIWDSRSVGDGNILYSGPLGSSRLIVVGDSVVVPEGSISITLK
jgi:hypothetical protein